MKANDPLDRLLRAAAQAERASIEPSLAMPFGWETRVLAASRGGAPDLLAFLPLLRRALAGAGAIALACATLYFQEREVPDVYQYTLNYSLASAYLE